MIPKEKAQELYNLLWSKFPAQTAIHFDLKPFVKDCCIIWVEEIIKAIDWHEFETPNGELNYWEQVKVEIKNYNP